MVGIVRSEQGDLRAQKGVKRFSSQLFDVSSASKYAQIMLRLIGSEIGMVTNCIPTNARVDR
jgi:hypothetical protein